MTDRSQRPGAALGRIVLLAFRLNGQLLQAGDRLAAPVEQTSARWQVMGAVYDGPATVSEVARRMGLRRQSVQRTADLLVGEGVAAFDENPRDRRARLLRLTDAGRHALQVIERAQQVWARELEAAVGRERLEDMAETMNALIDELTERDGA